MHKYLHDMTTRPSWKMTTAYSLSIIEEMEVESAWSQNLWQTWVSKGTVLSNNVRPAGGHTQEYNIQHPQRNKVTVLD